MLGCDGGGSAMEQEPQQMEKLKLSIYHPPESNAQAKSTIERSASELQSDDLLNIFVEGTNSNSGQESEEKTGIEYPSPGDTTVATFLVPAGNYDVDLLGFEEIDNGQNSAVVFATTGTEESVNVNAGEITEVNFSNGATSNGLLSNFDLSFDANLEFQESSAGNKKRPLNVTLQEGSDDPQSDLADRLFPNGSSLGGSLGGVGIDPGNNIERGNYLSARDDQDFTSRDGATLSTDAFNLPPGQYKDGTASVLLQLQIDDKYVGDDQNPVYLYNNVDGSAATDISLFEEGDGGIIVII